MNLFAQEIDGGCVYGGGEGGDPAIYIKWVVFKFSFSIWCHVSALC